MARKHKINKSYSLLLSTFTLLFLQDSMHFNRYYSDGCRENYTIILAEAQLDLHKIKYFYNFIHESGCIVSVVQLMIN